MTARAFANGTAGGSNLIVVMVPRQSLTLHLPKQRMLAYRPQRVLSIMSSFARLFSRSSLAMRRTTRIVAALWLLAVPTGAALAEEGDEAMNVYLNQARVLKLDRNVSKVIIGSAEIADATVADAKTIVLTGKGIGTTNLVIFDDNDNAIFDQRILVSSDEGKTLRVYRSTARSLMNCAPSCEEQSKK